MNELKTYLQKEFNRTVHKKYRHLCSLLIKKDDCFTLKKPFMRKRMIQRFKDEDHFNEDKIKNKV